MNRKTILATKKSGFTATSACLRQSVQGSQNFTSGTILASRPKRAGTGTRMRGCVEQPCDPSSCRSEHTSLFVCHYMLTRGCVTAEVVLPYSFPRFVIACFLLVLLFLPQKNLNMQNNGHVLGESQKCARTGQEHRSSLRQAGSSELNSSCSFQRVSGARSHDKCASGVHEIRTHGHFADCMHDTAEHPKSWTWQDS